MAHGSEKDLFVGLDYHQGSVQVCVLDGKGRVVDNRGVANCWHEIRSVAEEHGGCVRRVAIEAMTGAADLAEQLTECAGWSVDLAHPGYVSRMKGSPDKTDWTDARLLADLTRVGYLPKVWLAPSWVRELRRLVRYRQQQADERRAARLRISALLRDHRVRPSPPMRTWTRAWRTWLDQEALPRLPEASVWIMRRQLSKIQWLEQEIAQSEDRLCQHTAEDALTMRLLDQYCVGPVTAWVLRAEVGRFDRFDSGKSLARFCATSPRNASSGDRQADAGLVKAGSRLLRATLIELAHRLCRWDPRWREMKRRLRASGKPGSVAVAAVANRWVRQLYYVMIRPPQDEREKNLTGKEKTEARLDCAAAVPC